MHGARCTAVIVRSEQVDSRRPIRQGRLVETIARVAAVGHASMHVEVDIVTKGLLSGVRELCTRGRFTMIALDGAGVSTIHPP